MSDKYNPWTLVNVVFHHLVDEGLHPVLGETGDPAEPAAQLLRALGVEPAAASAGAAEDEVQQELADLRAAFDEA
ncbi:MAG: hypothetical protein GEV09_17220 [Pseudonocardiaceae bacterium]|nr:hypothetical protein [Pseudonocardiaceae bacterium]